MEWGSIRPNGTHKKENISEVLEQREKLVGTSMEKVVSCKKIDFWQCCRNNSLLIFTMAGVVAGSAAGFILRETTQLSEEIILCISYPGEIFMRVLKLIILPLIISSIISCCASLNARLNGKIAVRTFTYFVLTSLLNACLGIGLAFLVEPGRSGRVGVNSTFVPDPDNRPVAALDAFLDIGRNVFPDNLFEAFFMQTHTTYVTEKSTDGNDHGRVLRVLAKRNGTNNIGIIVICLLFGTILGTLETPSSIAVIEIFKTMYQVVMKIMYGVMWMTPIGISSVICGKIMTVEDVTMVVKQLGWLVLTIIFGVLIYQLFIMQIIYFVFLRRNPFKFYWGLLPGMLTAFATASTAAALPVTFKCMDEKLKMNQKISRYVLTIGCSINMDGTALFLAVASVFIAQLNDFPLEAGGILTLILVCTAASMSSASVPSAALVLMLMVLSSVGCPIEDVSLLFAVDWLVDRCRTTNNMLGDCYASAVIEHLSKEELTDLETHNEVERIIIVGHKLVDNEPQNTNGRNGNLISSTTL